jgi:zinc-ribbon domain
MFCPKCGTENPDNGKFCRSCGANITNVLAVVESGSRLEKNPLTGEDYAREFAKKIRKIENNPTELYSTGVRNTILGAGFLITSIFIQRMPGDTSFWLLFLIPAFCFLASGIRRIVKAEEMKKERESMATGILTPEISTNQPNQTLPPSQQDYVEPVSIFQTKDLIEQPVSITENTTRNLEIKSEIQTNELSQKT